MIAGCNDGPEVGPMPCTAAPAVGAALPSVGCQPAPAQPVPGPADRSGGCSLAAPGLLAAQATCAADPSEDGLMAGSLSAVPGPLGAKATREDGLTGTAVPGPLGFEAQCAGKGGSSLPVVLGPLGPQARCAPDASEDGLIGDSLAAVPGPLRPEASAPDPGQDGLITGSLSAVPSPPPVAKHGNDAPDSSPAVPCPPCPPLRRWPCPPFQVRLPLRCTLPWSVPQPLHQTPRQVRCCRNA